ncbi:MULTISPECIES: hypothetical protein [Acidiphilium]|uniref:hypothetical protein n=1 Tax=Acidiphilium TaxID=522 RepID=UPI002579F515|nr:MULTISPECIES: hypothetical protein [Acidiphilium]HQT85491.1 hypothetical protein [Acidiphilium rubrum]
MGTELDSDLTTALNRADQNTLSRIVEALHSSPSMSLKKDKEYLQNKDNLSNVTDWLGKKILSAGGFGIAGITLTNPSYKEILIELCNVAKIATAPILTVPEIESRILAWAYSEAKKINPSAPSWDGLFRPSPECISFLSSHIIEGFKNPDFMNSFKQSVNEVNKDLKGFFDIFLKWGPHILKLISAPSVKNMMPGWIMAAVAAMGALFTEGAVAAATATAAAAGGVAAAAGAGVAAAAYATLIGVYAGLQFAGPTTPALFLVAFELAIARLPVLPTSSS